MINPLSNILIVVLTLLSCVACNRKPESKTDISAIENNDSIPTSVKQLVRAVAEGDSVKFSKLVSYPLSRPYPLHNVNSPEELEKYYRTMVDDSLRSVITNSTGENWDEYGWRGWSLDRGEYLWIDDNVYDITYVSQAERQMLDSLRRAEIESLHPSLRDGWQPVGTLLTEDKSTIYRIDSNKTDKNHLVYRLCSFESGTSLAGMPSSILTGYKDTEGTASTEVYHFTGTNGEEIIYEPEVPDGTTPQLEILNSDGTTNILPVRPAYWLDIMRN